VISVTTYVVFCIVCSVLAFRRHPIWGFYFYLATTFVYPPARWWGHMLPDLRWALLSAVLTTLAVVFHQGKLQRKPPWISSAPAILLTLYAVVMWLQTPWALDIDDHLSGSTYFVKALFAFWLAYRVVDTKERVRDLAFAIVLGCGLLGIYCQATGRENGRLDGVGGPNLDDSNTLGMYLVAGLIVGIALVLSQSGWRRYVSLASLAMITQGFILANSRGALLGLVGGVVTLALCKARQHRRLFWIFAIAGALGLSMLVDRVFIDRMFTIQDVTSDSDEADPSARSRVEIAKAQIQMFLDHPMGTGHRGTAALSAQYLDRKWLANDDGDHADRSSHNTFLTTLVEQGIVGAMIYAGLVLWVALAILRVRRMQQKGADPELVTLGAGFCGALLVVFAAGLSADFLIKEIQFWFYGALVSVLQLGEARSLVAARREPIQALRPIATGTPGAG
jgi:O-antigen ligase